MSLHHRYNGWHHSDKGMRMAWRTMQVTGAVGIKNILAGFLENIHNYIERGGKGVWFTENNFAIQVSWEINFAIHYSQKLTAVFVIHGSW